MAHSKPGTGEQWLPKTAIARAIGVSRSTLERLFETLPADARRQRPGGRGYEYSLALVQRARGEQIAEQARLKRLRKQAARELRRRAGADDPADPMLNGPRSPALEAYREARAARERLALAREKDELIPAVDCRDWLARLASRLRSAGQQLQRIYGSDAQAVLDEAVDDIWAAARPFPSEGCAEGDGSPG